MASVKCLGYTQVISKRLFTLESAQRPMRLGSLQPIKRLDLRLLNTDVTLYRGKLHLETKTDPEKMEIVQDPINSEGRLKSHNHNAEIQIDHDLNLSPHLRLIDPNPNISLLFKHYRQKIASNQICQDAHQARMLQILQPLHLVICDYETDYLQALALEKQERCSIWPKWPKWMFSEGSQRTTNSRTSLVPPRGLYLYGDVGCGKTMLMDLFLEATPLKYKNRVHWHSFMRNFHDSLYAWRSTNHYHQPARLKYNLNEQAINFLTDEIIQHSPLLCFDEMHVTDIGDAMILHRLFDALWKKGAVVIITSNRPPDDLYKNGLQRESFLPFIAKLKEKCNVHNLNSKTDYRQMGIQTRKVFFTAQDSPEDVELEWQGRQEDNENRDKEGNGNEVALTHGDKSSELTIQLELYSRSIVIPRATVDMAWFTFEDLCNQPLAAADYQTIATHFPTLFLVQVPPMSIEDCDQARRFIMLIDQLYEHHVTLIMSTSVNQIRELFPHRMDDTLTKGDEEVFQFERTLSRLAEMQSHKYLSGVHLKNPHHR